MWNFELGEVLNLFIHIYKNRKKKKLACLACVDH